MARRISGPPVFGLRNGSPVEQHRLAADGGKIVFHFEIRHKWVSRDRISASMAPKFRDVPLAVAEIVDQLAYGGFGVHTESFVEGPVGRHDAQVGIEHQQRFLNGFDDGLGVLASIFETWRRSRD